jgi:ABC-type polysaccharide transport system permease subunit
MLGLILTPLGMIVCHCWRHAGLIRNTILLSVYGIVFGFPAPIIFALLLNEVRSKSYRSVIQTISYLPNFVSTVVIVGIFTIFLQEVWQKRFA